MESKMRKIKIEVEFSGDDESEKIILNSIRNILDAHEGHLRHFTSHSARSMENENYERYLTDLFYDILAEHIPMGTFELMAGSDPKIKTVTNRAYIFPEIHHTANKIAKLYLPKRDMTK